jgi:hypothetical protein
VNICEKYRRQFHGQRSIRHRRILTKKRP